MISSIQGILTHLTDTGISLSLGFLTLDVLTLAFDRDLLEKQVGSPITLHTLAYLEGDPNRGNLEPRLLGFTTQADRAFFELFTTVKGIGPKTAMRALDKPVSEIAAAIESKNAKYLGTLKGVGKRTAELIVAELAGKCGKFVLGVAVPHSPGKPHRNSDDEDAIQTLVTLGERRSDAEVLLDRARKANPDMTDTNALVGEMLRLRGG